MKNIFSIFFLSLFLFASILLVSCSDNDTVTPGSTGNLKFEFDNVVGNQNLVLNGVTYKNAAGEDYTVSMLNYYVSNFKLLKADGSSFTIPQDSSYFMIKESSADSRYATLKNIPAGEYTGVEFMIGVDSVRNTLGLDKWYGVLDQGSTSHDTDGMYWSWNSGFIFLKLEGSSPAAPVSVNGKFRFHIGLYGGRTADTKTLNNTRTAKVMFGSNKATIGTGKTPEVHLLADVAKIFNGSTSVSIAANPTVMTSDFSKNIANNYVNMFSFDHIHD